MSIPRDRLHEEIAAVPDDRIPDLLRLVHDFRMAADPGVGDAGKEANDFCGIWADLPDQDFDAFLGEVEERRRQAFASRPSR